MNICSKPATTKEIVCHNGKDIYHYVTNEPWHVTVSGQPYMDLAEYKVVLDKEIADKIVIDKIIAEKVI